MYGAVVSVSFVINSEQHTAGTSFTLSHMRTEEENNINNPHSKKHFVGTRAPIYLEKRPGAPWPGGPLVVGQEPESPNPPGTNSGAADAPTDFGAPQFNPPGGTVIV